MPTTDINEPEEKNEEKSKKVVAKKPTMNKT